MVNKLEKGIAGEFSIMARKRNLKATITFVIQVLKSRDIKIKECPENGSIFLNEPYSLYRAITKLKQLFES